MNCINDRGTRATKSILVWQLSRAVEGQPHLHQTYGDYSYLNLLIPKQEQQGERSAHPITAILEQLVSLVMSELSNGCRLCDGE